MSFGGTLAVLVVASIYNNSRLTDLQKFVSELMRADDGKHEANIRRVEETTVANARRVEETTVANARRLEETTESNARRVEELLLHKFAELDDRLNRIETKLNM
jgi:hypothetical protein